MPTAAPIISPALPKILNDRDSQSRCQIRVPDLDQPLEAIYLEGRYYGLMKSFTDKQKMLDMVERLGQKQEDIVLASQGNGVAIWIWEPNAVPLQVADAYGEVLGTSAPLLTSRKHYHTCRIELPDGDRCAAIVYQSQYYSFFRTMPDRMRTVALVEKLEQRQNQCLVTQTPKGYGIWALEENAIEQR